MNTKLTVTIAALLLASGAAFAAVQEGRREAPRGGSQEQVQRDRGGRGRAQRRHKRDRRPIDGVRGQRGVELRERVREHLGITEQQRAAARDAAKQVAPIADEVRAQAREILGRARELRRQGDVEGARAILRAELRPLLEGTRERIKPHTRPLIQSLTPEQRQKIESFLERRGRKFDEDRAAGRLGWWLSRRGR